jgi:NADPH:quinone reductase
MAHAVRVHQYGGPDVLQFEQVTLDAPGQGQVQIRQHAVGLNYIDVYLRTGLYPQPSFPFTPGAEGAGEVTKVGPGVTEFAVGDRVAYAGAPGAYADERNIGADKIVKIPASIDYKTAASMMLKGMTTQYLLKRTYKVGPGTTMLFHAAAGGVGLMACQWAKHLGATIIATAGSADKCQLAKAAGATHTINYRTENFAERVKEITGGKLCDVVYDSVGKDTFPASLDCIKPLGLFVTFGNASGPLPPINAGMLSAKGSLYMTRPSLGNYTATRADLVATANDVMDVIAKGIVKIDVNQAYPLREAKQAHIDLESRKTTGSTVLLP